MSAKRKQSAVLRLLRGEDLWTATPPTKPSRARYYPHQWPQGAAQGIIEFFDLLVG
jgi:hypothetical protein